MPQMINMQMHCELMPKKWQIKKTRYESEFFLLIDVPKYFFVFVVSFLKASAKKSSAANRS
jgi:hypothetical protein